MTVYTIGHSVHPQETFLDLLRAHAIDGLADVRTVPKSRRHPHFARERMAAWLADAGIAYRHFPDLGGLRAPRPDSVNGGWRHQSFRGYADHMGTPAFAAALDDLAAFAGERTVAVMCAEAKWWECHRQLIADALLARGAAVRHIMSRRAAPAHALTDFARVDGRAVIYPPAEEPFTGGRSLTP